MAKRTIPRAPAGVGSAGRSLWRAVLGDVDPAWELDARELHLLASAAHCADEIADLEGVIRSEGPTSTGSKGQPVVHPAIGEARQLRLTQLRLLSALELSDPASDLPATPAHAQARRAATKRWDRKTQVQRRRAEARNG